jgi:hypothetical protein
MAYKNLGFNCVCGLSYCTQKDVTNDAVILGPVSVIGLCLYHGNGQ